MTISGNATWAKTPITPTALKNIEDALDRNADAGMVVESALPVNLYEPEQVETAMGPAIEFVDGSTKSITFTRRWPFGTNVGLGIEIVVAADVANAGGFRIRVAHQLNGGAATNTDVTVTPGSNTNLYVANLGTLRAAGAIALGDLVTITFSRLGGDAADTHTGKMRLYHVRLKWV